MSERSALHCIVAIQCACVIGDSGCLARQIVEVKEANLRITGGLHSLWPSPIYMLTLFSCFYIDGLMLSPPTHH